MKSVLQRMTGSLPAANGLTVLGEQYETTRDMVITNIKKGNLHAHKRIAGIPCPDELTTKKMLGFFEQENLHIMGIKTKLEKAGLPFKAIIRTDLYNQIKLLKGVYTFENIDQNGMTPVSKTGVETFVKKEAAAFDKKAINVVLALQIVVSVIICVACEWLFCAYTWDLPSQAFWSNFVAFHIVILWWSVGGVCSGACWLVEFLLKRFVYNGATACKKILDKLSRQSLEILWPTYVDYAEGPKVKIDFIESPKHIASNILLWKNAGYTLNISAQKEAFSLNIQSIKGFLQTTIDGAFEKVRQQRELELRARIEARRRFWKKFDPIISAQIGEFTVLIDAYGGKSFVSETEVVDSVVGYYNDKLKQFQTILN